MTSITSQETQIIVECIYQQRRFDVEVERMMIRLD